jgi:hypothetical protein
MEEITKLSDIIQQFPTHIDLTLLMSDVQSARTSGVVLEMNKIGITKITLRYKNQTQEMSDRIIKAGNLKAQVKDDSEKKRWLHIRFLLVF